MVDMNAFNMYLKAVLMLLSIGILAIVFVTFVRVVWMLSWLLFGTVGAYVLTVLAILSMAYTIYGYQAEATRESG
jgi:hypothetical protein